ncbi:hypothetical protein ACFLVI_03495 [Chloroflexota bacterium]
MGTKWLGIVGKDWITDLDILFQFPSSGAITWIAPKWLTAGDLLFFYHTKSARGLIKNVLAEACQMRQQSHVTTTPYQTKEIETLITILERVDMLSKIWTGKIFAVGEVSDRPQRAFDENKHFKGTIYAPLASVVVFERPISSDEFKTFLRIGQNTITPIYGNQFSQLKELLAEHNKLPSVLTSAVPGDLSFRDVNKDNWADISCRKDARFINEAQLRAYLLDYLLREIKDSKTPIYSECNCYRHNERTGIADYFIRFNNKWVPIEAKLNVLAEQDLRSQLEKYIHIDSFSPTLGSSIGGRYPMDDESCCLVFDQSGMYITHNGEFINCSSDKPLIRREDIKPSSIAQLREQVIRAIR